MKKITQTILAVLFAQNASTAQNFPYATIFSDFTLNYSLSCGLSTQMSPGLLWAGYQSQTQVGGNITNPVNGNFYIRGWGQSSYWGLYKMFQGNPANCTGPMTQVNNMTGVSFIEAPNNAAVSSVAYAVAGAYDDACFFTVLNSGGVPIASMQYPFTPYSNNMPGPSKPVVVEDPASTDFFIAGSVAGNIYVNRVSSNGSIVWSRIYDCAANAYFADMVVGNANINELMIVGSYDAATNDRDALVLQINAQTGVLTYVASYGLQGTNDEFRAVIASLNSGAGGASSGYVIAGMCLNNSNITQPWMMKMDLNSNVVWSNVYQPVTGANQGFVDVIERRNTSQNFEYYGLVRSSQGMVVIKTDDLGAAFPLNNNVTANEFLYNLPGTANAQASCLSMIAGNTPNPGLQVYGTAFNIATGNTSYIASAYFNGVTNCNYNLYQTGPVQKSNANVGKVSCNIYNGLDQCSNFSVGVFWTGGAMNFPCSGLVAAGNNSRGNVTTGITEETEAVSTSLYPNPVKDVLSLDFEAAQGQMANISVTDLSGRDVISFIHEAAFSGQQHTNVNFEEAGLSSGMYLVNISCGGKNIQRKVSFE